MWHFRSMWVALKEPVFLVATIRFRADSALRCGASYSSTLALRWIQTADATCVRRDAFDGVLVGLNVISAHVSVWVLEVAQVVDCFVHKAQRQQLTVCGPLVRPDCCSWSDDALDDGKQHRHIPSLNELDVPLLCVWIVYAKHPMLFGTQLVDPVIFCLDRHAFVDMDDLPWTAERRWRIHQLPGTNVSEVLIPLYSGNRRDHGHAQNHLDGCLVCPQEEQPDEFIDLQTLSFKEGAVYSCHIRWQSGHRSM